MEELKGDSPKIFGFDYYNVIYCAAGALAVIMAYLWMVIDDPEVGRMVMVQGFFSICLLMASMYFRKKLEERKAERALEKKKQEEEKAEEAARLAKSKARRRQ